MATFTKGMLTQEVIDGVYEFALEQYDETNLVYPQLFDVRSSDKAYETGSDFVIDSNVDFVEDTEAAPESSMLPNYSWGIKMRSIKAAFPISKTAIEDGKIDPQEIGRALGQRFARREEQFAASFFNKGAYTLGDSIFDYSITEGLTTIEDPNPKFIYDGQPFFDTAHPLKASSSTYSNYNASNAFTVPNLKTAITQVNYTNAVDNTGAPVMLEADTLLIPSNNLKFTANEYLQSSNIADVATNNTNSLNNALNVISWRYLTDADGWFVGAAREGLRWYNRTPLAIEFEYDKARGIWFIYLSKRVGAGVTNWRYWLANNTAASA